MADTTSRDTTDRHFALARDTWRQFHGLWLDRHAPTQPEIDGRLMLYQRSAEAAALRDFAIASILLMAIGKVLIELAGVFAGIATTIDVILFLLTCLVLVITGGQSLMRLRTSVEQHALSRRVDVEGVDWSRIDSMLADVRDPAVRDYINGARRQGRRLRRAEVAVVLQRSRQGSPLTDLSDVAFRRHVRGRNGVLPREMLTGAACMLAVLLAGIPTTDAGMLLPPLFLLAAWSFGDLLGSILALYMDPWELRSGGRDAQRLRRAQVMDLSPPLAILLGVVAIHIALVPG